MRVAVVGAGYFAQFHHDAWKRIAGAELVGVADHDISRADATGVPAFSGAAEMLQTVKPDLVDIATPPATHLDLITLALDHGVRAIICQKPFCGDLPSAERAVHLANKSGATLVVHENVRFQPWYRQLRTEIQAGRIGDLLQFTFRLRPGDGQGPGAYFARQPYFRDMPRFLIHETGVLWIDTFRFLLGEPDGVIADLHRLNPAIAGEDAGTVIFTYNDGRRGLFDANRLLDHAAENPRQTMGEGSIEGTEGEIKLRGDGSLHFRRRGTIAEVLLFTPPASNTVAGQPVFGGDCVYALQNHVVAGLRDHTPIENEARDYLVNIRFADAVYRAAETGVKVALHP